MSQVLSGTVYEYVSRELINMAGNYLEIGVFNGTGFARIARENPTKKCYAVDPFIEDGHTIASSNVTTGLSLTNQKKNYLNNTKDLNNVVLFEMTSKTYAEQLTDTQCQDLNISVVTIDGNHHYDHVVVDFNIAIRLIGNKSGQIVVDDTDVHGVKQAYDEFKEKYADRIKKSKVPADQLVYF